MGALYSMLKPEHFADRRHAEYWRMCLEIVDDGRDVSIVSVKRAAIAAGFTATVEGQEFMSSLLTEARYDVLSEIGKKARELIERHLRGRMVQTLRKADVSLQEPFADVFGLMEGLETEMYEMLSDVQGRARSRPLTKEQQAGEWWRWFQARRNGELPPVPTPLTQLTALTAGVFPSDMIVIAARPSVGKTALADLWQHVLGLRYGIPSVMFSLEMSRQQIMSRHISIALGVGLHLFRTPDLIQQGELRQIEAFIQTEMAQAPVYIEEAPALTPAELRMKIRHHVSVNKVKIAFIDYLQLMSDPSAASREQEVARCSRAIKACAMEFGIPIVTMSQLNRALEARADKMPTLADLRESGSIEQDSDTVIFIHRAELYRQSVYSDGTPTEGTAELIVAKQRNGPTGLIRCAFVKDRAMFANLTETPELPRRMFGDGEPF